MVNEATAITAVCFYIYIYICVYSISKHRDIYPLGDGSLEVNLCVRATLLNHLEMKVRYGSQDNIISPSCHISV